MRIRLLPILCLMSTLFPVSQTDAEAVSASCVPPGVWMDPASRTQISADTAIARLSEKAAVLIGESHTSAADHRWQLQLLAALQGRRPGMTIGFESFPRSVQPALDRWVAGDSTPHRFMIDSRWAEVWGYDVGLYMPLFHFARMNRLPMAALNVERRLVSRVGDEGWSAIPAGDREGLTDPAPAPAAYVSRLAEVYAQHREEPAETPPTLQDDVFRRFVEAQLTWDRAMAEAIATAGERNPGNLIVGIMGRGHLEYGYGVPHQLADLGTTEVAVLLTWTSDRPCSDLVGADGTPVADLVFGLDPEAAEAAPRGPRLGVTLSSMDKGVRIDSVLEGSIAEAAGLEVGDIVIEAASEAIRRPGELAAIVRRQAPGTWLPLTVARSGGEMEIIAKFPARPHPPMPGPSPHSRER